MSRDAALSLLLRGAAARGLVPDLLAHPLDGRVAGVDGGGFVETLLDDRFVAVALHELLRRDQRLDGLLARQPLGIEDNAPVLEAKAS